MCLGGLGIVKPNITSDCYYQASHQLTTLLVEAIGSQDIDSFFDLAKTVQLRNKIRIHNQICHNHVSDILFSSLSVNLQQCIELAKEKGSSSWLSAVSIELHGFYLNKSTFCDAICLRYGWSLLNVPHCCHCSKIFQLIVQ